MKLSRLLSGMSYELLQGDVGIEIMGLADNSKQCTPNSVFFAIVGGKCDGTNFIDEAVNNGAICVVVEKNILDEDMKLGVVYIKVSSVRKAISSMCQNYYINTGVRFKLIGITGTNGKTTTSFMIGETLINAGYNVCVVGTSGIFVNGKQLRGEALTTPDPIELYSLFAFLNSIYVDYVVMEVSAHALELEKVYGLTFDYSIFTNLTEDHLDFFENMGKYGKAKAKLLESVTTKTAIINIDDEYGKTIALLRGNESVLFYGKETNDYKILGITHNSFKLIHNNKSYKFRLSMPGEYNYYNAAAAIIVLLKEKVNVCVVKKSLKNLSKIDGRFNEFKTKQHGKVILDFAHTPDGLSKLLSNVRDNLCKSGRVISVFGCGGNRDKSKRPIMGRISGEMADYTIISIDNPRNEDAESVMQDIEKGIKVVTNNYDIVMPRAKAIERAISLSSPEDVVVVSGKGTEPYYEVNGHKEFYREDIVIECIIKNIEG